MEKLKNKKGITLIALVITIIVLLILAGIVLNLTLGEHGILNRATQAGRAYEESAAREKVELMLADFAANRAIGDTKTLEGYLNEQKEKGLLEEVTNNGDGTITVEVDGYEITIKESDLTIVKTEKAKQGVKPNGIAEVITEGTIAYGNKVEIKVRASIEEGTIVGIIPTNGAKAKDETEATGASVEKIYEVGKNGTYYFTLQGSNGINRTINVKVTNIEMPEVNVSVTEVKAKKFTISVSTTYGEGIVKEYKYYVNGEIVKEGTLDTSYIVENLQPETKYGVYVEAYEESGESIKSELQEITTPTLPPAGASEPSTSNAIRAGNKLPFTWPQLNEIAKLIANNSSITSDTAEFTLSYEGEEYLIGVGDWTTVPYNGNNLKVRIMGFNHDDLAEDAKGCYGGDNSKAGISFEFAEIMTTDEYLHGSIVAWKNTSLRSKLNNTIYSSIKDVVNIKKVTKTYCTARSAGSLASCDDYIWCLSYAEIWKDGKQSGGRGLAYDIEGSQYKYYKNINASYSVPNDNVEKMRYGTSWSTWWWLRSTYTSTGNACGAVDGDGKATNLTLNNKHGVSPGFCI